MTASQNSQKITEIVSMTRLDVFFFLIFSVPSLNTKIETLYGDGLRFEKCWFKEELSNLESFHVSFYEN